MLHPSYPYIVFNDLPKVENLKTAVCRTFIATTPVTVMAASKPGQ